MGQICCSKRAETSIVAPLGPPATIVGPRAPEVNPTASTLKEATAITTTFEDKLTTHEIELTMSASPLIEPATPEIVYSEAKCAPTSDCTSSGSSGGNGSRSGGTNEARSGGINEAAMSTMKSDAQIEFEQALHLAQLPVMKLEKVLDYCGSIEQVVEILQQFQEQCVVQQAILQEYLETEDWFEFASEAHSLKSATVYLSLPRLTAVVDKCMTVGMTCGRLAATKKHPAALCQQQIAAHKVSLSVMLVSLQDAFYEFRNALRKFLVYRMTTEGKQGC